MNIYKFHFDSSAEQPNEGKQYPLEAQVAHIALRKEIKVPATKIYYADFLSILTSPSEVMTDILTIWEKQSIFPTVICTVNF